MKLIDADKLLEWIQDTAAGQLPSGAYGEGIQVALKRVKRYVELGNFDVEGRESIPKEDTNDVQQLTQGIYANPRRD